jgi:hypothetical protein
MNRKELAQKAVFVMEGAAQQREWPGAADALIDTIADALRRGVRPENRGKTRSDRCYPPTFCRRRPIR